jgi:ATPase subunit of ABC transporter with duplicated ATPase domains
MRSFAVPSLHLRGLTYAHTSAATILTDVNLDISTTDGAWVGLVGPNGAGKTTLLRLLAGDLEPTAGSIDLQGGHIILVPQDDAALTNEVRSFAWTWDGKAARLRSRLNLDPDQLDGRWLSLSPGQRKRWQLAAALTCDPDVLLLDEPTNHLDDDARELVQDLAEGFRGLGVIVSHDRAVLDRLTRRTMRLDHTGLEVFAGPYSEAVVRWRDGEDALREEHDRARREVRRQRRVLGEVRRDRHSAEAGPRRARRIAGPSEPDAREAGRKGAQRKAEAALAQRVRQMNARVGRAEADLAAIRVGRDHTGEVAFREAGSNRPILAQVVGAVDHPGGETWLQDVDVVLHRGERVHVAGRNGAGKTTLLSAVTAALIAAREVVGQLPQQLDEPIQEVARLHTLDPGLRGRVLGVVAALGVDPERLLVTDRPSPGEARKLALAHLLAGACSVIVLDEPTNHLDLPSIERLETALATWPGALLLVTHDETLAAAVTTTTWVVEDGRVQVAR